MAPLAGALHSSEPSTVWNIMILEGTDGAEPMALFRCSCFLERSSCHWPRHHMFSPQCTIIIERSWSVHLVSAFLVGIGDIMRPSQLVGGRGKGRRRWHQ